ncbi:MAG: hypothetical protein QNJ94_11230 [Alphaproteobacteria bacterium]|nr:hypothetical protein [Alphaproteobacteria bacterium]
MRDELLLQTVGLPLAATLVLFWLALALFRTSRPSLLPIASAAVAIAFLLVYLWVLGAPPLPPRASTQKLAYVCLAGLIIGIAVDVLGERLSSRALRLGAVVAIGAVALWLGWPKIRTGQTADLLALAGLWAGGAFAFDRLTTLSTDGDRPLAPGILLLSSCLAVAALGFHFASASVMQLASALAVAIGAYLLWNWLALLLRPALAARFGFGALCGAGGALFALACILAFFTKTAGWALAIMLLVFLAPTVSGNRPAGTGIVARASRPALLFAVSLVPVVVAVAAITLFSTSSGP